MHEDTKKIQEIPKGEDFADVPADKPVEPLTFKSLQKFKIDPAVEVPPPEVALKLQSQIVGTLGNLSLLIGKAKSRKSFLSVLIAAAALQETETEGFSGHLPPDKKEVLIIDTEQGEYHATTSVKRIVRLTGKACGLHAYRLRELSTIDRFESVRLLIENHPNAGLVIIDGVRDIATGGINDEETATHICDLLMQLSATNQCHITTVLHQNKNDTNARGHLGSELVNKAETTFEVAKDKDDKDISTISVPFARNEEPEMLAFTVNDHGLPEILPGWQPRSKETKADRLNPDSLNWEKHLEILKDLEPHISELTKPGLLLEICASISKVLGENVGRSTAERYKVHYERLDILQNETKPPKPAKYKIHLDETE